MINKKNMFNLFSALMVGMTLLLAPAALAGNQSGHFTQVVWANTRYQAVDLNGDGRLERFQMDIDLFTSGLAEGQVDVADGYFVKVERGTIADDGVVIFDGSVYYRGHDAPLGDIRFSVQQARSGDEDATDTLIIDVVGGEMQAGGDEDDVDVPDCIIWDIDGASVVGTLVIGTP